MKFAADFETNPDPHNCRVWAWGLVCLDTDDFIFGTQLHELFDYLEIYPKATLYYHNLKFDGSFLLAYLFKAGYQFKRSTYIGENGKRARYQLMPGEFTTSISDLGVFYTIEIVLGGGCRLTIRNSTNVLPMALEDIPAAFGLPYHKLKIDYELSRGEDYLITEDEIAYLERDCRILAAALRELEAQGMRRITTASNAMEDYKNRIGRRQFKRWFPAPYYDADIRRAYRGGFAYLNPLYKGKDMEQGVILDINSMYPYILREMPLPYGEGKRFEGEYQLDKDYPLYTQRLRCIFELKPGKVPTIQIKNKFSRFRPTEYLFSSMGDEVDLTLTSVDLELFLEHYEVSVIEWVGGWKFKAGKEMFKSYIDYWMGLKIKGDQEGKPGLRTLAKQMMVSLYGKFGMNTQLQERTPYLDAYGMVSYHLEDPEPKEPIYIPIAVFVTAWGRKIMIDSIQTVGERFIYCDTDSLHLIGWELPKGLKIDPYALGSFKVERYFTQARYLRPKSYITLLGDEMEITCSNLQKRAYDLRVTYADTPEKLGLIPKDCPTHVNWDNFHFGTSYYGNLTPRTVPGGTVLVETIFTLRD